MVSHAKLYERRLFWTLEVHVESASPGQAAGGGANTALTAASISIADSGRTTALQVPSDREYRLYEIAGIDRVAFVHEDSSEVNIFAACSTF